MSRKKYLSAMLFFIACIMAFQSQVFAQFNSSAGSAVLMEASTGRIIYEKDAEIAKPPASITKLMTLLLGFEAIEDGNVHWDDLVPVSEKAWRIEGSRMFLEVGTKLPYRELITGISVDSANDGCVALAEYLYGSESAFVQVMNQKAKDIGMTRTQFMNSTGLPEEGHYMSARDIAVLARYLITKFPEILEIESMTEFTYNNIKQYNRNPLLGIFPGADGLKTGWTDEAGYCLVGTALQNDVRLLSVILNTEDEKERLTASQELLNYGFKHFGFTDILVKGDIIDDMEVRNGKELNVSIQADSDITVFIPLDRTGDVEMVLKKDIEYLNAPVSSGEKVGTLEVRLDGEVLAASGISATNDVAKAGFFELLFRRLSDFFHSLIK